VHARPREVEAEEVLGEQSYKEFNPLAAYEHLEVVARAAKRLLEAHDPPASRTAPEQLLDGLPLLRPVAEQVTAVPIPAGRPEVGVAQKVADETRGEREAQPMKFVGDALVAPARILPREA
jgi:hypothetical protein